MVIFGASGAGKTTILEYISGLLRPDEGSIILGERTLFDGIKRQNIASRERRIGYVFQNLALFPHLTARKNVSFGLRGHEPKAREAEVNEILKAFRVDHVAERLPARMSGGEKQRVALGRSLVTKPDALLLDEPLTALDHQTKTSILRDLREWHAQHKIPLIFVTHSIEETFAIADRVLRLADGKITGDGPPLEILRAERERLLADLQGPSR